MNSKHLFSPSALRDLLRFSSIGCFLISLCLPHLSHAQEKTLPMHMPLTTIVDADGNDPTDPNGPLFRRGTDAPLTDRDGVPVTLDQFNDVGGEITIKPRPGGGTEVSITATNLLPNELYTVWAGYWQDPGHPAGNRIGFGAVSEDNLGLDNAAMSDADGNATFSVVQEAGPMTIQGVAPSYAPISPIETSPGVFEEHFGYAIGVAYHFGDYPVPAPGEGWVTPGPGATWALHGLAEFPAVPEPGSAVLLLSSILPLAMLRRRRRA